MQSGPSVSQRAVSSPPTKCSGGRDNVSPPRVIFLTPPLCSSEAESEKGFQKLSRLVSGRKKEKKNLSESCFISYIQHLPIAFTQTTSHYGTIQIQPSLSFVVRGHSGTCNYFLSPLPEIKAVTGVITESQVVFEDAPRFVTLCLVAA